MPKTDTGPELGPDAPWILVEEHSLPWGDLAETFTAVWNYQDSRYASTPHQGATPVAIGIDEITAWAELEEPAFTLKGAA